MKENSKSNRKKLIAVALLLCLVLLIGGISYNADAKNQRRIEPAYYLLADGSRCLLFRMDAVPWFH